jgi:hypothetical protein
MFKTIKWVKEAGNVGISKTPPTYIYKLIDDNFEIDIPIKLATGYIFLIKTIIEIYSKLNCDVSKNIFLAFKDFEKQNGYTGYFSINHQIILCMDHIDGF